ncbi:MULTISPECIES: hypothetical protein [unclassified Streptomyces]|nr:hypothetical protein [Streptomyces sp. NBC_00589]WTI42055.1 hypothetical protein OIC96_47420 [Streptomyces sp. NBC_00775]WUB24262.1 hypothetical protein OHA51_02300 [Streptomyces sp. NBC_00589]
MGDPYFPQDGNGGIDVLHHDVRDGYRDAFLADWNTEPRAA